MQVIFGTVPIYVRFAANGLAFTAVLLLVLTLPATIYLLVRRNKQRATWWLGAFLICIDLALLTMFLVNSIVLFGWALNPLQDAFVCLSGVALARFAYNFPASPRPRAATAMTLVLAACAGLALAYALVYAGRGFALGTDFNGAYPRIAPAFYLLTPLAIAAVVGVFTGRAVELARASAPDARRFAGWRGALRALASPPTANSRAHRNFALAISLGMVQAAASFVAAYLNSAAAMVAIALGALMVLAAVLLVYLNRAPEPHSLVVRLVGISLVCLLGVLTLVGHTAINVQARQLEIYNDSLLQALTAWDTAGLYAAPDPNLLLVESWDADALRAGNPGKATIKFLAPDLAGSDLPARLEQPPSSPGAPTEPWTTTHPLILPGPPPLLAQVYYVEADGRVYAIVTAGMVYVRAVQELNASLMLTALLGAAVLFVLLPLFVRSGLIAPLQRLVAGIRRADRGDLDTPVPVQFEDEIGFVIHSFNRTIVSVRATQQALREANERQEAVVVQRTAQLAAALDAAEEAKRAAEHSEREARAANEAKSTFLANVSHELRTPLTVILGRTDLLSLEQGLTLDQYGAVAAIQRAADHLLEIVDDVLELRKVEAGQWELHSTPFRPALLATQLEELFRRHAAAKGLALSVRCECPVDETVVADQRKVRQIAVNLISNAIKFTDEGEVRVKVSCVDGPGVGAEHAQGTAARRLVLVVEDTGPGIAPENGEAIWQPFFRQEPESPNAGAGLGLVISRDFAALLGGELTMQSTGTRGEGCVFRLDVPVEAAPPARPAAPMQLREEPGTAPAHEARILVVDDAEDNRELLTRILRSYQVDVQAAAGGSEAIRICTEWRPHLIFMDMRMPEMDGHSTAQQIRELCHQVNPAGEGPKIVALTAHAFEEQRQALLDCGFDDLVRKPYRRSDIAATLERHLRVSLASAGGLPGAERPAPSAAPPVAGAGDEAEGLRRFLHDVRNPLTTISLSTEMALDLSGEDGTPEAVAYREHLERIERNCRLIESLIGDMSAQVKRSAAKQAP